MTASEAKVSRRLMSLESAEQTSGTSSGATYFDVVFNLDFSKWNLRFNSSNADGVMEWLDGYFGLDGVYQFTHTFFESSLFYLSSRYHPDPNLNSSARSSHEGMNTVYESHFGGVEGLRQKGWTTATFAVILSICDRLRWRASLTGQGDNQAVRLSIRLPDGVDPRTALHTHPAYLQNSLETFFRQLSDEFATIGLPLKPSETWWAKDAWIYSKDWVIASAVMPMSLKRATRIQSDTNDVPPDLGACLSTSWTSGLAAAAKGLSPFGAYAVSAGVAWSEICSHAKRSPVSGTSSTELINMLKRRDKACSAARLYLLTPTALGGMVSILFLHMLYRGNPLRNKAKREAKRDRIRHIHSQLIEDIQDPGSYWRTARNQKRGFQGAKKHLVVDGKPQPWSKTHEVFSDRLQNIQWKTPHVADHTAQIRDARPNLNEQQPDEPDFTRPDLESALQKLKARKAAGPDRVPNELLMLLDEEHLDDLLSLYNTAWQEGAVPQEWAEAIVVSIYKGKAADTDPSNYRPISLLNTIYKVYAAMLQSRMAATFDQKFRPSQYGFRAARGTVQPLFILRRAMEWSLMTNKSLHVLSLDWKQAFDSLDHTAMITALRRFGLSAKMLAAVESIYLNPTFMTKGPDGRTAHGNVHSGIRQGCPLSPYLFVAVLTVVFADIDALLQTQGTPTNTWSEGYPTYDIECADDTLLLGRTTTQLQAMLSAVEQVASEYGMRLNHDKTELLITPGDSPKLFFSNGDQVKTTPQIKCLGSLVSWQDTFTTAFYHRAGLAESAFKKA